jgi:virginiamycin B lyase
MIAAILALFAGAWLMNFAALGSEPDAAAGSSRTKLRGRVTTIAGQPIAGALVTAREAGRSMAVSVLTDKEGRYEIPRLTPANYGLQAHHLGFRADRKESVRVGAAGAAADFRLSPLQELWETAPSAMLLRLLPEGEAKRRFILDCTGCHQFDQRTVSSGSRLKSWEEWRQRIQQMLSFAGAQSSFPIMSPSRDAEATAAWLVEQLGDGGELPRLGPPEGFPGERPGDRPPGEKVAIRGFQTGKARLTEYDLPESGDLPHDLALDKRGRVIVTGMFTHRMYELDPEIGTFEMREIPVESANPRAVELDEKGNRWVLLGGPQKLARYSPTSGKWDSWGLGMYPHSIGLDARGAVWFNGHFTKNPELLGRFDPSTGKVTTYEVPSPPMPDGGSTIPYELRLGNGGTVWMTQLVGNRLVRFDPGKGSFQLYELPTPHSGPRRIDLDARGYVWIPEYAGNKLARFDPAKGSFREYEFPVPDALPYVARVDMRRGSVWIGTAAADLVARFDPQAETFTLYPLPTRGALIRHMAVDERTGALWAAYSPAPPRAPRILRIEPL